MTVAEIDLESIGIAAESVVGVGPPQDTGDRPIRSGAQQYGGIRLDVPRDRASTSCRRRTC